MDQTLYREVSGGLSKDWDSNFQADDPINQSLMAKQG